MKIAFSVPSNPLRQNGKFGSELASSYETTVSYWTLFWEIGVRNPRL